MNNQLDSRPETTRRDFLKSTAILCGSLATGVGIGQTSVGAETTAAQEGAAPLFRIDCHTHFFDPTRPQGVPWPGKGDKRLYRQVLPKHFHEVAEPVGVAATIVVEASPWVEDNQWLLDIAETERGIVGVVGNLDPAVAESAKHLKRFAANKLFRGIRVNSNALKAGMALPEYRNFLGLLIEHDLELDVNGGPDLLPVVVHLVEQFPDLRVVINHIANVRIDGKTVPLDWQRDLQRAAKTPRVFCKVSALVESAARGMEKAPADLSFYKPTLDAVWSAFGDDRLIYGSDWPVSERVASYALQFEIIDEYLRSRPAGTAEKFYNRNAAAAYQWVKR